ncbi:putative cytochrome P450 2D15-like [Apostichopus japonicus]|uniref:Putative cytochrome P450 2D15-like n=1 Tax=Stichopus japonicus TaxID=307972 RepID=A0A2G8L2M1_STIJA|nr:putative cytochrome P450 2D15-like [Apostichopus japonicus]
MELNVLTVTLLCFIVLIYFIWIRGRPRNLPPGPLNPLAVLRFQKNVYIVASRFAKKYGAVYSMRGFGGSLFVMLNSIETIKEAMLDKADSFSDRTASAVFDFINEGSKGSILFGHGENWKEMRKFGANALRNFGVGKRSVANKISEETHFLVAAIKETKGNKFDPVLLVNNAVSNIICNISFGERYDYDNVKFQRLLSKLRSVAGAITVTSLLHSIPRVLVPMISYVPPFSGTIRNFVVLKSYVSDVIREHQSTLDSNDVRDIIDMYLLEAEKQEGLGKSENHYDLGRTWRFIMDLFAAGSDTTTNSLLWTLAIFCHYPEVQEKIYKELLDVVGVDRLPTYEERSQLPYTEAVILEVQRFRPVVPLVGHLCSRDETLGGYFIPKGSKVVLNIWASGHDSTKWENPDDFNPERFLSPDGKTVVNRESHIPFSIGRRVCLGETLAKTEIFIFLTGLVQRFRFRVPDGDPLPSLDGNHGVVLSTRPYEICAEMRA